MTSSFYEQPILNSPYAPPSRHHPLDKDGQPLDEAPRPGRRPSRLITPVPKARKKGKATQAELGLHDAEGLSTADQEYDRNSLVNAVRAAVDAWRALPNPANWSVTPTTERLLRHWRTHPFSRQRPFFCQVEAAETAIWLAEVSGRDRRHAALRARLDAANTEANPELFRIALKMATGTGKTTVMAMLIAWHTLNAVRTPGSSRWSRGFLLVTPGITIKDRLRVLKPEDPENYYRDRELVPADMLPDMNRAKVVITNYHAFKPRETLDATKGTKAVLYGRDAPPDTLETDGQVLRRVADELLGFKGVVVINDEAHHCYRAKPGDAEEALDAEGRGEARRNDEAARLWISGLEAVKRKLGITALYDLSATPFFLRGSGYAEGTLFPWVVSDFSLMDAIESGIVKLPRIPVSDNLPGGETPMYRNLWDHIGKAMPKSGRAKAGKGDPLALPNPLQTALYALYGHYEGEFRRWQEAGIAVPPVFIVVCNNTATSELVYEWISGFERDGEGEQNRFVNGHLALFRNYDEYGTRLHRPSTLLIDSEQVESGDALDPAFRAAAEPELDAFRREKAQREGAGAAEALTDADILREVMNTVGRRGRLGETVRCVVSVSMLTEGWDTNTVTHVLGVRAFGTQLLCEQVVGRALRRQSYELGEDNLFSPEYADIMGIPFDFAAQPVTTNPKPPKPVRPVRAVKEREALAITFPRVVGYRNTFADERVEARFNDDSRLVLTPEQVGASRVRMEAIVGKEAELDLGVLQATRQSSIGYELAKHLLYHQFREADQPPPMHLFGGIKRVAQRWLAEGYLQCLGGTEPAQVLYPDLLDQAAQLIFLACQRRDGGGGEVRATLDPFNPRGSTAHVGFTTSRPLYATAPTRCHVDHVVLDSDWEAEFARVAEAHPRVLAYVKNQGLGLEVPYRDGGAARHYWPDYVVRIEDGRDDPLHLVVEVKGFRGTDAQLKAETMRTQWVPGVNNLGSFGRWAFAEFRDVYAIESAFAALVAGFLPPA